MRIAVAQLAPVKGNVEKNVENHVHWIKKAIEAKADMLFFPELSITGYEPTLAKELVLNQDDERFAGIQQLCDAHEIIVGIGAPTGNGDQVHISMIIFRPNQDRVTYTKQYLHSSELDYFTEASNPMVIKCKGEIVAPAICYELSNKGHHDFAVANKSGIYLASVLNSVTGVESDIRKLSDIASKYGMVALMANFVGESGGYDCGGKSSVWNEKGELMAQLDGEEEGVLIYDGEKKKVERIR